MPKSYRNVETALIHAGEMDCVEGAVVLPIFQSSTYEFEGQQNYEDLRYIRLNNTPNQVVLQRKLAELESAEAALVTSSGMAAITATLLSVLSSGDHLLAQKCLYGGTWSLLTNTFPDLGIEYDFIAADSPDSWEQQLRPQTKVIYVESISNPLTEVGDFSAIVNFARQHNLVSIIDNTFATPIFFRPIELGFDLVVHSATKYLNGHTDIVAGAVAGTAERVSQANARLLHLGGSLDPHACFLLHRGLKTLSLRVRQQSATAMEIAKYLRDHPAVVRVDYPGLPDNPNHERATQYFDGFGGMLSFELDPTKISAATCADRLDLPVNAPSLGGVESLVTIPAQTSHCKLSASERARLGIADNLIRYSVGIEAAEDLIDDLRKALSE